MSEPEINRPVTINMTRITLFILGVFLFRDLGFRFVFISLDVWFDFVVLETDVGLVSLELCSSIVIFILAVRYMSLQDYSHFIYCKSISPVSYLIIAQVYILRNIDEH